VRSAPCTWRRGAHVSWLSVKTRINGLSVVWSQNHCDSLSVVWSQNHWDGFSRFGIKISGDGFSRFGLKTGGFGFPGFGVKISSSGLVIWTSKSSQWFLSLCLKIRWTTVYQLRYKIDEGRSAWDTHQDLAAYFA
jgi:hypothetical protein